MALDFFDDPFETADPLNYIMFDETTKDNDDKDFDGGGDNDDYSD